MAARPTPDAIRLAAAAFSALALHCRLHCWPSLRKIQKAAWRTRPMQIASARAADDEASVVDTLWLLAISLALKS